MTEKEQKAIDELTRFTDHGFWPSLDTIRFAIESIKAGHPKAHWVVTNTFTPLREDPTAHEAVIKCDNCGFETGYSSESDFCPKCGSAMVKEEPKCVCEEFNLHRGDTMYCNLEMSSTEANFKTIKDINYCPKCGKALPGVKYDYWDGGYCKETKSTTTVAAPENPMIVRTPKSDYNVTHHILKSGL